METATCEYCGRTLPVDGSVTEDGVTLVFQGLWYSETQRGEQSKETVAYTVDPFQEEIYHDETEHWICESCWYESAMDI